MTAAHPEKDPEIKALHKAGDIEGLLRIVENFIKGRIKALGYTRTAFPEQRGEMLRDALVRARELLQQRKWDPGRGRLFTYLHKRVDGWLAESYARTKSLAGPEAVFASGSGREEGSTSSGQEAALERLSNEDVSTDDDAEDPGITGQSRDFRNFEDVSRFWKAQNAADLPATRFAELICLVLVAGVPEKTTSGGDMPASITEAYPGVDSEDPAVAEAWCLDQAGQRKEDIAKAIGRSRATVHRYIKAAQGYLKGIPKFLGGAIRELRPHFTERFDKQYREEDERRREVQLRAEDLLGPASPSRLWRFPVQIRPQSIVTSELASWIAEQDMHRGPPGVFDEVNALIPKAKEK